MQESKTRDTKEIQAKKTWRHEENTLWSAPEMSSGISGVTSDMCSTCGEDRVHRMAHRTGHPISRVACMWASITHRTCLVTHRILHQIRHPVRVSKFIWVGYNSLDVWICLVSHQWHTGYQRLNGRQWPVHNRQLIWKAPCMSNGTPCMSGATQNFLHFLNDTFGLVGYKYHTN